MEKRDETESTGRAASPVRALGRGLWKSSVHLALVLGWIALAAFGAVLIVERTGWLRVRIERELAAHLAELELSIRIGATRLRWSEREIALLDVAIGTDGRDARVGRVALRLGWREPRGLVVERAEIAGGSVRISRELVERLQELVADADAARAGAVRVVVRDLDVAVETPGGGEGALGRLDLLVDPTRDGARILGRLATPGATNGLGEAAVRGELAEGRLTLRTTARGLVLDGWLAALARGLELPDGMAPSARIDVDVTAEHTLARDRLPSLEVRARVRGASARLPQLGAGDERVQDVSLDAQARFAPGAASDPSLLDRRAWTGRARAGARWRTLTVRAGAAISPRAQHRGVVEAWVDAPEIALDDDTVALLGRPRWLADELFRWLEPRGRAAVHASARVDAGWQRGMRIERALEAAVCVFPAGRASAAYHGPRHGDAPGGEGFPLRLEGLTGAVVFAWNPRAPFPDELGLFALTGDHGSGSARIEGTWHHVPRTMRPLGSDDGATWFWLRAASPRLPIDDKLRRAFAGLGGVLPPEDMWELVQPGDGELDFDVELWSTPAAPRLAARIDARVSGASAAFRPFPLPVHDASGTVHVIVDGRHRPEGGGYAVQLDLGASSRAAGGPIAITGRIERTDTRFDRAAIEDVAVDARALVLDARELEAAVASNAAELVDVARRLGLHGAADVRLRRTRERSDEGSWTRIEAAPSAESGFELPELALRVHGLGGRVIARLGEHPPRDDGGLASTAAWAAPLAGALGARAPAPIALRADLRPSGAVHANVHVAGLDLGDEELMQRVAAALGGAQDGALASLPLAGSVDLHAALSRPPTGSMGGRVYVHPRALRIGPDEAPLLSDVEGEIVVGADGVRAKRVSGRLADTPIDLSAVQLAQVGDAYELSARVHASQLPLDQAHVSRFVRSESLRAWIDDLRWRGKVDVDGARLAARFGRGGVESIALRGDFGLSDLFVRLGVPIAVRSATAREVELVHEDGSLRAWGRIDGLYAQMDGRRLDDASMLVTFIQPRLTIESFHGRFEEGELSSLGGSEAGGGFLALDLVPPYPFGLSIAMNGVDIGGLLRGLFQSDFANQGRLRGSLRLNGDTAHLSELLGQGFVELRDSSLWSIPVFQALFSQLGLDATGTFDEMRSSFSIERGAIHMRNMRVESPLLHLVGEGTLGLDGSLSHDLEVRYSLVDRLGPLTALLYKIQRSLLRVRISGNMERPEVVLKGLLPEFFQRERDERRLPVPRFSELPPRF